MSESTGSHPEHFTRTRSEFGQDAIAALQGVLSVLESLEDGYVQLNRHPPLNTYEAAVGSVKALVTFTNDVYVE